jgi:hypothetical protein
MRLRPSKIVLITSIFFGCFHFIVVSAVLAKGGDTGMSALLIDFPMVWLAQLSEAGRSVLTSSPMLVLGVGGTIFYAGIGALIGYVIQFIRDA